MSKSTSKVLQDIAAMTKNLFTWFQSNSMKASHGRFHIFPSNTGYQGIEVWNERVESSCLEKLLGTKIGAKLKNEECNFQHFVQTAS